MLSSLAHVLIVTPIIFLWLRERELRRGQQFAVQTVSAETIS
jgi:Cu(I)/Ag(I) efflux system membrane protein CusA/SilA